MSINCAVCSTPVGYFESFFTRGTGRCRNCNKKFNAMQQHFYNRIDAALHNGALSLQAETTILQELKIAQLPEDLVTPVIAHLRQQRNIAIQKELQNLIEHHFRQGTLLQDTEKQIASQASSLPHELSTPILQRLRYLRSITEIQRGNIPHIQTGIHLDSDEYAHFEMQTVYYKPNKRIKEVPGRLIGTNKKCYFISDSGSDSATIDWNNVSQVQEQSLQLEKKTKVNNQTIIRHEMVPVLHLSVSKGAGGGGYKVSDRYYTKILIDTIVRMWKRQLVLYAEMKTEGTVPEHVKRVVFQRDNGKCVQCGYSGPYIEYDHRIPRSKGGQNTIENIQLLCRMCNLKKSNRL